MYDWITDDNLKSDLQEVRDRADAAGVGEWADKVEDWVRSIALGHDGTVWGWALTDDRYTYGNLASADMQDYDKNADDGARWDELNEVESAIIYVIEDLLCGDHCYNPDDEDGCYHQPSTCAECGDPVTFHALGCTVA